MQSESLVGLLKSWRKNGVIIIAVENMLRPSSSIHDMVVGVFVLDAEGGRHGWDISESYVKSQCDNK